MTELGKVVEAMHTCLHDIDRGGIGRECHKCPYCDVYDCEEVLLRDALKILETQKPKVMGTKELENSDFAWLELRDDEPEEIFPVIVGDSYLSGEIELVCYFGDSRLNFDKYGKIWRCWSDKPTEEQRKAEVWDD